MILKDYYGILEIPFHSTPEEIKTAYRRLAVKWHPDKNLSVDTTYQMVEINEAYQILSDEYKRQLYDQEYRKYQNSHQGVETSVDLGSVDDTNLEDIIKDAREKAEEYVKQFMHELKNTSNDAMNGCWDEVKYYIIIGIIFTVIGLAFSGC
jgi:DnaJ-class molecular chaperone